MGDTFQRPLLPSVAALPGLDSPTILACLHVKCRPWASLLAPALSTLRTPTSYACLRSTCTVPATGALLQQCHLQQTRRGGASSAEHMSARSWYQLQLCA